MKLFETAPTWADYNLEGAGTQRLKKYWSDPELGGGPITADLSTPNASGIKTPLRAKMQSASVHGYYEIKKIQDSKWPGTYFDVWLLSTDEDVTKLEEWSKDPESTKCCWGSGEEVQRFLNGFGRMISYYDPDRTGDNR